MATLSKTLINKAKSTYTTEIRMPQPITLKETTVYLEKAADLAIHRRLAPPIELLQFHCTTFVGNRLTRFSPATQLFIVLNTAESLHACEDNQDPAVATSRRQLAEDSPQFLKVSGAPSLALSDSDI